MVNELTTITLDGCAPTPLASYLKALAVLRLLSTPTNSVKGEAADPAARGWWAGEHFHLRSRLDRVGLSRFFLENYAPSPIIGPWNGRAGFLEGDAGTDSSRTGAQLMKAIEASQAPRFRSMRLVIERLRREPMLVRYDKLRADTKAAAEEEKRATGLAKAAAGERRKTLTRLVEATKSVLLASLRSNADSHHLAFIDACFVLAEDERAAPLLGSGGNDGSRDFGVNFAAALDGMIDFGTGRANASAGAELEAAIFAAVQPLEETGSIGQFGPGQGGANGSTGYEGWNPLNRWDVVLALEGALLCSGALTRRWGVESRGRAAFPFTFEPSDAGSGALSSEDPHAPRGEIWTPLWSKPSSFGEIEALFAEGRLTLGQATARTGLEAARAVARLGVSRGIEAFERYSLIQPDAKMPYQATPLGRFRTPDRPRDDPLADLDAGGWLAGVRRLAREKNAPARARLAVHRFEDALFDVIREERERAGLQAALAALGGVVSWLATSRSGRERVTPPPRLSRRWINGADDGTPEFRIAVALASLGWAGSGDRRDREEEQEEIETASHLPNEVDGEVASTTEPPEATIARRGSEWSQTAKRKLPPPMAAHFAPVEQKTIVQPRRSWAENDRPGVVRNAGNLVQNMIAVLERRLIEQALLGLEDKPLAGTAVAHLADVAAFMEGGHAFDDARCAALLAGLVWARPARLLRRGGDVSIPFAYAALKPLFTPNAELIAMPGSPPEARQFLLEKGRLPIPPGLIATLRRNAIDEAVRQALGRARASGISSPFDPARSPIGTARFGAPIEADRLAAALLIPIHKETLTHLVRRAYPKDGRQKETDNAA
jgi:CRISPR-associated protein Csx17